MTFSAVPTRCHSGGALWMHCAALRVCFQESATSEACRSRRLSLAKRRQGAHAITSCYRQVQQRSSAGAAHVLGQSETRACWRTSVISESPKCELNSLGARFWDVLRLFLKRSAVRWLPLRGLTKCVFFPTTIS